MYLFLLYLPESRERRHYIDYGHNSFIDPALSASVPPQIESNSEGNTGWIPTKPI